MLPLGICPLGANTEAEKVSDYTKNQILIEYPSKRDFLNKISLTSQEMKQVSVERSKTESSMQPVKDIKKVLGNVKGKVFQRIVQIALPQHNHASSISGLVCEEVTTSEMYNKLKSDMAARKELSQSMQKKYNISKVD